MVASAPMLAFGYPDSAVLPIAKDWGFLMCIAVLSFINQMCLNRGFQLEVAAKASAVNYTQVGMQCNSLCTRLPQCRLLSDRHSIELQSTLPFGLQRLCSLSWM